MMKTLKIATRQSPLALWQAEHIRARLEALLGVPIYLETWVKVLPRWRKSRGALARFGFPLPDDEGP